MLDLNCFYLFTEFHKWAINLCDPSKAVFIVYMFLAFLYSLVEILRNIKRIAGEKTESLPKILHIFFAPYTIFLGMGLIEVIIKGIIGFVICGG